MTWESSEGNQKSFLKGFQQISFVIFWVDPDHPGVILEHFYIALNIGGPCDVTTGEGGNGGVQE